MPAVIVQHPSTPDPQPKPPPVEEPTQAPPNGDQPGEPEYEDEPEPTALDYDVRELITMLKHEIGMRWMSFELRLQLEKVERQLLV